MTPLRRLPSPLFLAAFAALALAAPAQALVVITQEIDFNRLFSATTSTNASGGTEAALFSLYGGPASNLASVQISWTPDFAGSVTALVTNNSGPNPFNGHSGSAGGTLRIQYFLFEPIPEPGTWAMLIAGFGLIGAAQRRRRRIARRSITA